MVTQVTIRDPRCVQRHHYEQMLLSRTGFDSAYLERLADAFVLDTDMPITGMRRLTFEERVGWIEEIRYTIWKNLNRNYARVW